MRINILIRTIMTGRGCWRSSSSTPFFKAAVLQDQTAQDLVPWRLQDARILKKEEEIKKTQSQEVMNSFCSVSLISKGSINANVCVCAIPASLQL